MYNLDKYSDGDNVGVRFLEQIHAHNQAQFHSLVVPSPLPDTTLDPRAQTASELT